MKYFLLTILFSALALGQLPVTYHQGHVDYAFTSLLVALDASMIADLAITRYAVDRGAVEGNWIMTKRPLDILLKVSGMALGNYLFKMAYQENRTVAYIAVGVSLAACSWVVYHNYTVIVQMKL